MTGGRHNRIQVVAPILLMAGCTFTMITVFSGVRAFLIPAATLLVVATGMYFYDYFRTRKKDY